MWQNYDMKKAFFPAMLFLLGTAAHAQDAINLKNGKIIWAKVQKINPAWVTYIPYENPGAPNDSIQIGDVFSVRFQNGAIEMLDGVVSELRTKQQLQAYLIETIGRHGFEHDEDGGRYEASFLGDYLQLTAKNENGKTTDILVCDFSKVYQFQNVSKRGDGLAFINIFVAVASNKTHTKWEKEKLVMRVDHYMEAQSILEALRKYNALLKP